MKFATRLGLAVCVAFVALTPASANHSWLKYHWGRTANPFALQINEALSSSWEPYLATAMTDWANSTVLDFNPSVAKPSSASPKRCDPIAGQIQVCNAAYGQRGWLGIASIWANGDHITQGTTKLNDTYFNMTQYNTQAWRQMVTCQEIGHDFGLDHQDENFNNANLGTCMDYTNDPSTNQHPNQHDLDQLVTMYTLLDSTNTYAPYTSPTPTAFGIREVGKPAAPGAPAGFNAGAGDTAAEWGRAIHRDALGRPDVFLKDFGNGYRRLTHVLWALEAKGNEAN